MEDRLLVEGKLARGAVFATAVASLALVVSLVASASVLSRAYVARGEQGDRQRRTLDVTGSARRRITSDLALWTISVRGEGRTLEEAYERLAKATEAVRAFLTERGLAGERLAAGAIDTTTHFRYDDKGRETRDVVSYSLARPLEVTSSEPTAVAKAAGEVTELLKTGAHVESRAPRYVYTRLADLKVAMVGESTANGRERAERIAAESKCRLGAVREARGGVLQITPPWSADVSDSGLNDTSTIEKDVTGVVHLSFAIEAGS